MSDKQEQDRQNEFASLARILGEHAPPSDVMALGHMMRDWLKAVVADAGTAVDTGAGLGSYDLWVKMGGKEVLVQIKATA